MTRRASTSGRFADESARFSFYAIIGPRLNLIEAGAAKAEGDVAVRGIAPVVVESERVQVHVQAQRSVASLHEGYKSVVRFAHARKTEVPLGSLPQLRRQ